MLNAGRPQNPFTPTEEPDWKASKLTTRRSLAPQHDKLKDRNSHRPSPPSDRVQPLPLDTNLGLMREEIAARGGDSKRSSKSSVVSMSSDVARKMAPPIPKKPALLMNRQHSQESKVNEQGKSTSESPLGGQNVFDNSAETSFPPPAPRNRQQQVYGRRATEPDGPPLPPRSAGGVVPVSNGLMDDDDDEGASAIPSLQPMRLRNDRPG